MSDQIDLDAAVTAPVVVRLKLPPQVYDDLCRRALRADRTVHAVMLAIITKYRRAPVDDGAAR